MDKRENIFVIEVCENCRTHNWNTRHDENKYKAYAAESKLCCLSIASGSKDSGTRAQRLGADQRSAEGLGGLRDLLLAGP